MWGKKLFIPFILCFIAILGIFIWAFDADRISQEVLDLFPRNESKALIEAHRYFASSKYIPVAIEGESTQEVLEEIKAYLLAMPHITSVIAEEIPLSYQLYDFLSHNEKYLLAHAQIDSQPSSTDSKDANEQSPDSLSAQSAAIYAPLLSSFTPSPDEAKPIYAGDRGLMLLAEIDSLEDSALKDTLAHFKELKTHYPSIHYFSTDFMRVENLGLILQEVNFLLGFASLVFIILYFVIIRIPLLTFNTIFTLIFANTIAILLTLCVYPKVTIMALSFGMGISNIAIDYMMHHHFFGLYTHAPSYAKHSPLARPAFNRPVFYGYFTTMIGFGVCLFIPFPLLAQLALYAMISLTISYVSFAFIYPRIGFKPPRLFDSIARLRKPCVPSIVFLTLACVGFIFAFSTLKLDFDLSKLDYQNKSMLDERAFFANIEDKDEVKVLLFSQESDGLMLFTRGLLEHIGAVKFYANAGKSPLEQYYYLASMSKAQFATMRALFDELKTQGILSPLIAQLWNPAEIAKITESRINFDERPLQDIMDSLADSIYQPMLIVLGIALMAMLCVLAFSVRGAFISAVGFVLFPLSMALSVVASHSEFNMMHLFALLILVVVSVDYGIYAIKEGESPRTTHAILFSALTTGVSFGILITSHTKALNSLGEVIFAGMGCILILLLYNTSYQQTTKD